MGRILSPGPVQAHEQPLLPVLGHLYAEVAADEQIRGADKS